MKVDLAYVEETVARVGSTPDAVIPILQAIQDRYGYLPGEALLRVCEQTEISPAAVTGVASFYDMFRHKPVGRHIVRVCHGTACHVTGAERVEDALRRHLHIGPGQDTDPSEEFTIEPVACLGCCTLAPVVRIGETTFGHVASERAPKIVREFLDNGKSAGALSTEELLQATPGLAQINIGLGSCCMAKGSDQMFHALADAVKNSGARASVKRVGCVGMCHRTPLIEIAKPGKASAFYAGLDPLQAGKLVQRHFRPHGLLRRASRFWSRTLDALLIDEVEDPVVAREVDVQAADVSAFLDRQVHIATEGFGKVDPLDLDEYVANDGFVALARCLGIPPLTPALCPSEGERGRPSSPAGDT